MSEFNLNQVIDKIYGDYKAKMRAKLQAEEQRVRLEYEQTIAQFMERLDLAISQQLQEALKLNVYMKQNRTVCAEFHFLGSKIEMQYGSFRNGNWMYKISDDAGYYEYFTSSKTLSQEILIALGKIQEYQILYSTEVQVDLTEVEAAD